MLLSVSKELEPSCVGIDFGTTNSLVALYDASSDKVELVEFEDGKNMLSSEMVYDSLTIQSVKRIISCKEEAANCGLETKMEAGLIHFYIKDRWVSIIDVVADHFRNLRINTNQFFKRNIVNCIVTVPARYDEYQKQIVVHGATKAGWKVVRVIAEPTAGFIGQEEEADGVYGIYDLGGGTFDFTLIRKAGDVFQVLGTTGDISIGMDYIDRKIGKTLHPDKGDNDCLRMTRDMRERGQVTDLSQCDDMLDRSVAKCRELIDSIHSKPSKIYMIGGGSLNEHVAQKVRNIGGDVIIGKEPQYSVVNGAALYANWLTKDNIHLLIDVAPLSLGVETMHGMVEWIIYRNNPLPVAKKVVFTNAKEGQTHIMFNVVQGEGVLAKDCRTLGNFKVEIPTRPRNSVRIELTFVLDINGLLNISCIDLDTRSSYDIQFNSGHELTAEMVRSIVDKTREKIHETEEYRKFYRCCEEIDLILRNFPEERELLQKRQALSDLVAAEALLSEIHAKLAGKLQHSLTEVAQSIFDSLVGT